MIASPLKYFDGISVISGNVMGVVKFSLTAFEISKIFGQKSAFRKEITVF